MPEIKSREKGGVKAETIVSPRLRKQFHSACKKNNTNAAEVLRDFIKAYVKRNPKA